MDERTWIHAFTDGRDVSPTSAVDDLAELPAERIATVVGRYYAMDRDRRWERTERGRSPRSPRAGVAYDHLPNRDGSATKLRRGRHGRVRRADRRRRRARGSAGQDAAIFFNFRPDRARQLSQRLARARHRPHDDDALPRRPRRPRSRSASRRSTRRWPRCSPAPGVRQLHVAETEKYAHVTYFFNGGVEDGVAGRDADPRARARATSRATTTSRRCRRARSRGASPSEIGRRLRASRVINFANPDMVGHTGSIPAVVQAVEATDACLGRRSSRRSHAAGGVCLVTADHGNAEQMLEADGVSPHTAHTTNPVPLDRDRRTTHALASGGELVRPRAHRAGAARASPSRP